MKSKKLILVLIIAIVGNTACLQVKNLSPNSNTVSIQVNKNFINHNFTALKQILQESLNDFPNKKSPIRYSKKTATSTTSIKVKRKQVKINYFSSDPEKDDQEIKKIHRIKERIEAIK